MVSDQAGVPLKLTVTVHEIGAPPEPFVGAQVDIWHANALGLYSAEPDQPRADTGSQTFLRGYQLTDDEGAVHFTTLYPGWYEGRTPHIHVKVREFSNGTASQTFTTQIFFDEALNESVLAMAPYDERPDRDMTNDRDSIFRSELVAAVGGDPRSELEAEFRICLRR